jgi:hypothetical protein
MNDFDEQLSVLSNLGNEALCASVCVLISAGRCNVPPP